MTTQNTDPKNDSVRAVSRAVALMKCFQHTEDSLSLTELARDTGLTMSTAHRLLRTLVANDVLQFNPRTERYGKGTLLRGFQQPHAQAFGPDRTQAFLAALVNQASESASLSVPDGDEAVIMQFLATKTPLRFELPVGTRIPLDGSVIGQCLRAFDPSLLPPSATTAADADIPAALAAIRAQGYAAGEDEHNPGLSILAVPVLDRDGRAGMVVALHIPSLRFQPPGIDRLVTQVVGTARALQLLHHTVLAQG